MASSRPRRSGIARWQKATAVVPLALLAGAWSASLGTPTTATADSALSAPGVPAVPTTSLDSPASYTVPADIAPSQTTSSGDRPSIDPTDPSVVSINGIPSSAVAAYRRAAAVLAKADPSCNISWALVAAIGRVESDHGRFGGNVLGSDGRAMPGIYGVPLDGSGQTALIRDTDGGEYDNDDVFDRAVGPMQFIPSTWSVVGVDGDADGARDPQDIDDAALATAVYLCAGEQDLSTTAGQRSAVFSYNHSDEYVALVLAIMKAYLGGDYTMVADGLPASTFLPVRPAPEPRTQTPKQDRPDGSRPDRSRVDRPRQRQVPQSSDRTGTSQGPSAQPKPAAQSPELEPEQPKPPGQEPDPDQTPGTDPDPTPGTDPEPTPVPNPTATSSPDPTKTVTDTTQQTVAKLETVAEATQYCATHLPGDPTAEMIKACGEKLVGKTNEQAAALLSGTLAEVLARLGLSGLLPSEPLPTGGLLDGN